MFWKIDGTELSILGAVHLTNMNPLRVPPSVEQAFVAANSIVFESDLGVQIDPSLMFLPTGTQLHDFVSDTTYERAVRHGEKFGIARERLDTFKPGMAAMTLQITAAMKNGYALESGVDRHFWSRATPDLKLREYLETSAEQMLALTSAPMAEQASILEHFVSKDDAGLGEVSQMVSSWANGDIAFFDRMVADRQSRWPESFSSILDTRNTRWVPQILKMAGEPVPRLIIVGALHMAGPTGLPALLQQHGVHLSVQPW